MSSGKSESAFFGGFRIGDLKLGHFRYASQTESVFWGVNSKKKNMNEDEDVSRIFYPRKLA